MHLVFGFTYILLTFFSFLFLFFKAGEGVILVQDYACLNMFPLFGFIALPFLFIYLSYALTRLDSYHHHTLCISLPYTHIPL